MADDKVLWEGVQGPGGLGWEAAVVSWRKSWHGAGGGKAEDKE